MLKFILGRVAQNILLLAALGTLFFAVSGTASVSGFWIYVATVLAYQILSLLIIVPRYPSYVELAQVRQTRRSDVRKWDRLVVVLMMGAAFLMYGLAAWDVGRAHVSPLPLGFALAGILLYVAGSALNQWAMVHNPYFERGVRIQAERSQQVAQTGPYRYIRHPGYLGSILGFASFPLVVGSAIALVGSGMCLAVMLMRTYLEDKTLSQELAGYADYARMVRYRLMPYVW